jgi:hypothetical protein
VGTTWLQELYQRRRSFWRSAARLTKTGGVVQVVTYNGVVTLRSKQQARKFGHKLYQHLSKGGKVEVTPELIRRLFEERQEVNLRDDFAREQHARDISSVTSNFDVDEVRAAVLTLVTMRNTRTLLAYVTVYRKRRKSCGA